ncbi:AAA family ATPase [Embleya hyalina]|uniref:Orc1-like AAA ATPase domain-containing protein n=1 Tax=Embleya hyalina TaxID=516124 RepID=A0A401YYG0_9ACTN|nr:AAA family ATPase [Embleya hyalina]GCD99659.1 hypothetical protein EHYA_07381 [Embleya hyalina]
MSAREWALLVGVGRFHGPPDDGDEAEMDDSSFADLEFVDDVVPRVRSALEAMAFEADSVMDPDAAELRGRVQDALGDARIVYVVSHGVDSPETNPYRVAVVPSCGKHGATTNAGNWVEGALDHDRPTLFLFDLCRSGRAATLPAATHRPGAGSKAWVIAASAPQQDAFAGDFSYALAEVLQEVAETGLDTDPARRFVAFSAVARRIANRVRQRSKFGQLVHATAMDMTLDEPELPFFPNVRFDEGAASLRTVDAGARGFLERRDARHFTDKAGDHFTGRKSQLRLLAPWLDDRSGGSGNLRVVTGSPGVGKSALLGALACAAHAELSNAVPEVVRRLEDGCRPEVNPRLAAVHARGRPAGEVLTAIARQLDLLDILGRRHVDSGTLIKALSAGDDTCVLIVDALDESPRWKELRDELATLAGAFRADGRPVCRLLIGMRPWGDFTVLKDLAAAQGGLIDLDSADPAEVRSDLAEHIGSRLRVEEPYAKPGTASIRRTLARAVAETLVPRRPVVPPARGDRPEWGAFLVADVFTRYLASAPAPTTPEEAEQLGGTAPVDLPAVLEMELAIHDRGPRMRSLLVAFAHAQGEGMPLEVAVPLADHLARDPDTDRDPKAVRALLDDVFFYLRSAPDREGILRYRLFHQGLIDYLAPRDTKSAAPAALVDTPRNPDFGTVLDHLLATHTFHDGKRRLWEISPRYILRHVLDHAAAADRADELLVDPEFLVHADPAVLKEGFRHARGPEARLAVRLYSSRYESLARVEPIGRRQLLAVLAAANASRELVDAFAHGQSWRPRWAVLGPMEPTAAPPGWVLALDCGWIREDGIIVAGDATGDVLVRDLETGKQRGQRLQGHTGSVLAVACARLAGRDVVITGGADGTVRLWDADSGTAAGAPMTGHVGAVTAVAHARVDERDVIVTGGADGTVRLWDPVAGEQLSHPVMSHDEQSRVRSLSVAETETGPLVLSAGSDDTVRTWNARTGMLTDTPVDSDPDTDTTRAVTIAMLDGHATLVTGGDRGLRASDLTNGREVAAIDDAALDLAVLRIGERAVIAAGGLDHRLLVWDPLENGVDHYAVFHPAYAVRAASDGSLVIGGGHDVVVLEPNERP